MAAKGRRSGRGKKSQDPKDARAYDHKKGEEKLLLRPDVGLQAQFRQKKPPKSYRYDPSLDPALSWDVSADRERAEALIAKISNCGLRIAELSRSEDADKSEIHNLAAEIRSAAAQLRQMSSPFLNWAGKAARGEFTIPTLPLFVHERLSTQAILQSVKSHKRDLSACDLSAGQAGAQAGGNGPLYRVELLGLDVFDPVTMENDHRKGDDVPAWLLDTDYDDLVFHVTQAFFPRTSAWDHLKRALKGTYEDSVWEHLAGIVSEPFAAGEHKKIAVKVIDDRGNELMVVRSLNEAVTEP